MTEQEAKDRCLKLASESPDRETHSWLPRRGPDDKWVVVKLAIPSPAAQHETNTAQSGNQPGIRDDPRTAMEQNFPPWGASI